LLHNLLADLIDHLRVFVLEAPVDVESGDPGLVHQHIPVHLLDLHVARVVLDQFLVLVGVVDVVPAAEELLFLKAHGQDEGSHSQDVVL
jgi:hypothetical protein